MGQTTRQMMVELMNKRQYKKLMRDNTSVSHCAYRLLFHKSYVDAIDSNYSMLLHECRFYVLDGEVPRLARNYSEYLLQSEMFEKYMRVAQNHYLDGAIWVSTTFLGIDHSYGVGTPLLFESMCFGRGDWEGHDIDDMQNRYHTYEAALTGHREMCEVVEQAIKEHLEV